MQGLGARFIRRFYIVRNPETWSHQPELLNYDYNDSDTFTLYWARRLADETELEDSGVTGGGSSDTQSSGESTSPPADLASRPLTPDPRARGERSKLGKPARKLKKATRERLESQGDQQQAPEEPRIPAESTRRRKETSNTPRKSSIS